MLGQGCLKASTPSTSFPWISSPDTGSIMAGSMPKKGSEQLPGLVGGTPARGGMTLHPVSVCQYVWEGQHSSETQFHRYLALTSTTWHSSLPITSKYHFQTSA